MSEIASTLATVTVIGFAGIVSWIAIDKGFQMTNKKARDSGGGGIPNIDKVGNILDPTFPGAGTIGEGTATPSPGEAADDVNKGPLTALFGNTLDQLFGEGTTRWVDQRIKNTLGTVVAPIDRLFSEAFSGIINGATNFVTDVIGAAFPTEYIIWAIVALVVFLMGLLVFWYFG